MMHEMRLHNEPFEAVKKGTKTIELRLNDEKRQLIKVGDVIEFTNRANEEKLKVEVVNLHYFDNFSLLYDNFDKVALGYKETDEAKSEDMNFYYPIEEQEKYGVVGIEIKLI